MHDFYFVNFFLGSDAFMYLFLSDKQVNKEIFKNHSSFKAA